MPDAGGNIKGIAVPVVPWLRPHDFAPSSDPRYSGTCRKCGRAAAHELHDDGLTPAATCATVYR